MDDVEISVGRDIAVIKASGLFDGDWYVERYPDVRRLTVDPLWHYCQYGWREGRRPRRDFRGDLYCLANPDVERAMINPFCHYIKYAARQPWRVTKTKALFNALHWSHSDVPEFIATNERKVFHVTDVEIGLTYVFYTVQIESAKGVEISVPFKIYFNKPVKVYNSTLIHMFQTIFGAVQNASARRRYELVIDLNEDIDLEKQRADYEGILLADGTGLDSHAIKLLANGCKILKFATMADLKKDELRNIDPNEYDNANSVVITGENYLKNRRVGDVLLDFSHDGNRCYLLLLLIDHLQIKKVLTADCEKNLAKTYFGSTVDLYSCNFLYSDMATLYVNAKLDRGKFIDRILSCGKFPRYKNLRKYLVTKYLESRYKMKILTQEDERRFFQVNDIDIAGNPGIMEILRGYQAAQSASGGLVLLDSFLLALKKIDLKDLKRWLVHNEKQEATFVEMVHWCHEEYKKQGTRLNGVKFFNAKALQDGFGENKAFVSAVTRTARKIGMVE